MDVKYFFKVSHLSLEVDGFVKEYPCFYMFSSIEATVIKSVLSLAQLNGLNLKTRRLCFTNNCSIGIQLSEVVGLLDSPLNNGFTEIDSKMYSIYQAIPHWNPVLDAISVMEAFNAATEKISTKNLKENTNELIDEMLFEASARKEQIYKPNKGSVLITVPEII